MDCPSCHVSAGPAARYCSFCGTRLAEVKNEPSVDGESRFRRYIEHSPHGVFIADDQGRYVEVNSAACRITGYDEAELLRMGIADTLPADYLNEGLAHFSQLRETGSSTGKFPFIGKDGRRGWWTVDTAKLSESRYLGFVTDVTELELAESKLKASEAQLRKLIENAPVGVAMLDRDLRYLACSRRWLTDYRLEGREVIGRSHYEIFPEIPQRWKEIHRRCLCGVGERCEEDAFERADGSVDYLRWEIQPWHDATGAVGGLCFFRESITERKIAEKAVIDSHERLRTILDSLFGFVGLYTLDGTLIEANRAPLEAAGLTRDQVIGQPFWETYWWSYSPEVQKQLRDALGRAAQGVLVRYEVPVRVKDGALITIDVTFGPLRDSVGEIVNIIGFAVDITDRKRAEETLAKSELRLKEAHRLARLGAWELDLASQITWWSEEQYALNGVAPGTPITQSYFLSLIHPEDRQRFEEAFRRLLSEETVVCDYRLTRPDGAVREMHGLASVIRDSTGHPIRLYGTNKDITERKQLDAKLRASETRYRLLVEHATDAIFLHRRGGVIMDVNRRACDSLGYSRDELIGMSVAQFDPFISKEDLRRIAEHLDAGKPVTFDSWHLRKDGSKFPVEVRLNPLELDGEQCALAVARDITDRKRSEEALRAREKQLNEAQRIAGIGSWELDLETSTLTWSDEIFRMFELPMEQFVASYDAFLNAIHPEDREMVNEAYMNSVETRRPYEITHRLLMADGRIKFVHERGETIYGDTGRPLRSIGTVQDITDRRQTEEQMTLLRAQLAHTSRLGTLGEMSAGLAHELNQPLAALCLYATAAQDLGAAFHSKDLQDCLTRIGGESLRAGEIVRRMRSFVSRHPFRKEPADVNLLVREVLTLLVNELRHARVKIELNLGDSLPAVSVDSIQIQQVLVNLIRNGIEAMTKAENNCRLLSIHTSIDGSYLRVSISDTGGGIDPTIAAKIFEPFQSTKPAGLGLGLAICRTLVEAHGGSIGIEQNPTKATTFVFSIPADQDEAAS
jgi:PAS domain S-box-containing protein